MYSFKFDVISNNNSEVSLSNSVVNDVLFVDVKMEQEECVVPEQFSVKWRIDASDCCGVWNSFTRNHTIRPDWSNVDAISRLASGQPIQQITTFEGNNKICVAISDVDTPTKISMGYCEESAEIICEVFFFTLPTNPKSEYNAQLRIDMRNIPFWDWWAR